MMMSLHLQDQWEVVSERDAINNRKQTPVLTAALIAESNAVSKAGGSQKEWEEYNCFHCMQGGCSLMKHCLAV